MILIQAIRTEEASALVEVDLEVGTVAPSYATKIVTNGTITLMSSGNSRD